MVVPVLTLPNLITLLRIGAIPVLVIFLLDERYTDALVVFILAGLSDSLDGLLARWLNARTTLGAFIDPLADKLLLISSFVILAWVGSIPNWLAVLVISRDLIILLGFIVLFLVSGRAIEIRPTLVGKACTFFQLLTVSQALVGLHDPDWKFPLLWNTSLAATAVTLVVSGFQYVSRSLTWFYQQEDERDASH